MTEKRFDKRSPSGCKDLSPLWKEATSKVGNIQFLTVESHYFKLPLS